MKALLKNLDMVLLISYIAGVVTLVTWNCVNYGYHCPMY